MREKKSNPVSSRKRRYFVYGPEGAYDEYVERDPKLEAYVEDDTPFEDRPDPYEEEELKSRG
ncbi:MULTISPECIES: hypothetical protein [Exiguobacterium]|uniref:hypothetical protein n=1 Tax=Exiguobacterium TaxID=33986 RepID=UPI0025BCCAB4|nr:MULTISPECIES: hypothetical protein [Exiguobacterium]